MMQERVVVFLCFFFISDGFKCERQNIVVKTQLKTNN